MCSRNILHAPHCNPSDPNCLDVLSTTYHTLLASTLKTWSPKYPLAPAAFVEFVQSVLKELPSSSSSNSNATIFGEHLVDMIWSLDLELEELYGDFKSLPGGNAGEQGAQAADDTQSKAAKSKRNIENDKETIAVIVKQLLKRGIINPIFCRERLDLALLSSVGLISDKAAFDKREIRTRTSLFYKQNKFNLLREQSEGYSKLTAELTSALGPSHSPFTGRSEEPYSVVEARARPVWEKLISLIGYFDLDPNRALDIIIDVLCVNLATHYSFFMALLSFSPWAGSYTPSASGPQAAASQPARYKGKSLDEVLLLAEGDSPRSNGGSRVLAQVLGFKFSHYQSSETSDNALKSLCLTAALLIREGFISLEHLYPHLSPEDVDMSSAHKEYLDKAQDRISGAKVSQLAMAAPLESSSSSSAKPKPTETQKPAQIVNQKAGMVKALLAVGALRPAIAILTKFPWLVDAHTDIADLLLRIVKESISVLYDNTCVLRERNPSFTQPRVRHAGSRPTAAPQRRTFLTLWAPTPPSTMYTDFVFFFPDWRQFVPICSSLDDLVDVVDPLLRFVGLHISRGPLFVTKFLRLGRAHLLTTLEIDPETKKPSCEPDPNHPIRQFWFKITRLYLLPALPLIRGNAVCTVEIWNIIKQYETIARWRLYGEWKTAIYKSHPELRVRQVQADREAKGILRRLSHNTIDTLSGTVAKLAHSNPIIFFNNAVGQVMAYDNMAGVVIQSLKYVTNLGFDVLAFTVLDCLANPNKARVKDDGVNTSDWLQSLASFIGMLFRRYNADLTPVLSYIVHQLHNGQTTEIIVLRELIWKMAGIEPLPSLSDAQIQAMAGGPVLRIEAVASTTRGARLDAGEAVLRGPQRLAKGLLESDLALPLLIQVAQQRQSSIFKATDAHLKSLASLYDATHGVLLQYLEFLNSPSVISADDYANKILPPLSELGVTYGICPPICMQIIRPVLHGSLLKAALDAYEQERKANEEHEKKLKAELITKRDPGVTASRVASPSVLTAGEDNKPSKQENGDKSSTDETSMDVDGQVSDSTTAAAANSPWRPELSALFDDVRKIAPGSACDVLGPGFYLTFWQLSTYDLSPPSTRYDDELKALRSLSLQEDRKLAAAEKVKRGSAIAYRARRDRYNNYVTALTNEYKQQTISREFTIKRLAREKLHWFSHFPKAHPLVQAFIEHCIQPRCLLSPMDADYCAQIIKFIHTQGTPGFPTLICYDKLLADHIKVVLFSCSEYEARNYGRFLLGILSDLHKWSQDEKLFLQDNRSSKGCHPGFQLFWKANPGLLAEDKLMDWPSFKRVLGKWYRKLGKSFLECIQTGEFMHVYNSIIVLKEILPVFPLNSVSENGSVIDKAMDLFIEREQRGDLKILATSYSAALKKRESVWSVKAVGAPSKAAAPPTAPKVTSTNSSSDSRTGLPPPTGPSVRPDRNTSTLPASTPSGPRAQSSSVPAQQNVDSKPSANPTKLAMDSIPRPEVVKRVRPEVKTNGQVKMDVDPPHSQTNTPGVKSSSPEVVMRDEGHSSRANSRRASPIVNGDHAEANGQRPERPASQSVDRYRPNEDKVSRNDTLPAQNIPAGMPPPSLPSQTLSAQELRETAKQSIAIKVDDKPGRVNDVRSQNGSAAPSPSHRRRSQSPQSRPGTRNASADSRHSAGRNPSRHRNGGSGEDGLGKRRRGDDEPERDSKRSSRKDGHREDRSRRSSEKDSHDRPRDSEKRRKDRENAEAENRPSTDKAVEKRVPDGPASQKALPPSTPSAPRAMSSSDSSRTSKGDVPVARDRHRGDASHTPSQVAPPSTPSGPDDGNNSNQGLGSLRSRIGDKEPPPRPPLPSAPSNSYRPDSSRKDDSDRDTRKRTLSERDKEMNESASSITSDQVQPPKRPRINRNRYNASQSSHSGLAKKLLPIDREPSAGEKSRGRKD
ncbi:THO complex subunit 2 [Pleurotus pulmonarius]|nr:THO complex subunit 2 [Pleurotus pulmonarius]